MCDLISRQTVIDEIEERKNANGYHNVAVISELNRLEGYIMRLSTAQPEQSIAEWQKDFREYINMLNIPRDDYNGIMEYINNVPSAQLEPHYCRECKWSRCHIDMDKYGNTETSWHCHNWGGGTDEEGYCYEWERRTDG